MYDQLPVKDAKTLTKELCWSVAPAVTYVSLSWGFVIGFILMENPEQIRLMHIFIDAIAVVVAGAYGVGTAITQLFRCPRYWAAVSLLLGGLPLIIAYTGFRIVVDVLHVQLAP